MGAGAGGRLVARALGLLACALETPRRPAELYVKHAAREPRPVTSLNESLLRSRSLAEVESLVFDSVGGQQVEAFVTKPLALDPSRTYPMIAMIKAVLTALTTTAHFDKRRATLLSKQKGDGDIAASDPPTRAPEMSAMSIRIMAAADPAG